MRKFALLLILPVCLLASDSRGVEILWDKFGVAHVYARNSEGLFFGYVRADAEPWQPDPGELYGERRQSGGILGRQKSRTRRWVQINDVRSVAWRIASRRLSFASYLDAFADGMNGTRAVTPNADARRKRVLPITSADPLIHVHHIVHFTLPDFAARVTSCYRQAGLAAGWHRTRGRSLRRNR
jgi:acyl-homoserine-lactone acylase